MSLGEYGGCVGLLGTSMLGVQAQPPHQQPPQPPSLCRVASSCSHKQSSAKKHFRCRGRVAKVSQTKEIRAPWLSCLQLLRHLGQAGSNCLSCDVSILSLAISSVPYQVTPKVTIPLHRVGLKWSQLWFMHIQCNSGCGVRSNAGSSSLILLKR